MLLGKYIGLRAIEECDLITLRDWRNTEDFRKFFREYRELNIVNQKKWFEKYVVNDVNTIMFGIEDLKTHELLGVCGLCYIDWINRNADLSIYIGANDVYIQTDAESQSWDTLNVLLSYGFNNLNLHKVWSEIYSFDEKKHILFKKYGMHVDGVLRDNYFYDGQYLDSTIFSIISSEWRRRHKL